MTRLASAWDWLRSSLWFLPGLMALGAIVLAGATLSVDRRWAAGPGSGTWLYTGGVEGAREVLATIAASTIGIAGVTFSITMVAFSLAATQLGTRVLRSFMRDTGNQVVLGTFLATYLYCVLVLRTVQGGDGGDFVPNVSITVGVGLSILSLGVLIYFIHHVSSLMQAPTIIASVAHDLEVAIAELPPARAGEASDRAAEPEPALPGPGRPLHAAQTGYIQMIDHDRLLALAARHDLVVRLLRRPGHFVARGGVIAEAHPGERGGADLDRAFARTVIIGAQRTPLQDLEFAIHQLVEIAVRSLSPAINATFTAMDCIDRLGAALVRLAERQTPSRLHRDPAGAARIVADPVTYRDLVESAFDQIRQAARPQVAVSIRLLDAITMVGRHVTDEHFRQALLRQAEMIERGSRAVTAEAEDREDVAARFRAAAQALASTDGARAHGLDAGTGPEPARARPDRVA